MSEVSIQVLFNGSDLDVRVGATITELLEQAEIRSHLVAVEVNQHIVPRELHSATRVSHGDVIEAVTLVGGG